MLQACGCSDLLNISTKSCRKGKTMLKQVVLLICCFSVAASAQLVSNQSFEIGNVSDSSIAENWTSNSGISRTNETLPHSGDYCLKLEEGTDWLNASQVPDKGFC
jgi:capsule polysaccharide export protein KpsE/RkpR